MAEVFTYIILPSIILLVAIAFYKTYQQRLQLKKQRHQNAQQFSLIQKSFRTTIELLCLQNIIRRKHVDPICNIVNHYFIDHTINEKNIKELENLANQIAMTIMREVNLIRNTIDTEWVRKKMVNFTLNLPNQTQQFNRKFYHERLKDLITSLTTTQATYIRNHVQNIAA